MMSGIQLQNFIDEAIKTWRKQLSVCVQMVNILNILCKLSHEAEKIMDR